MTDFGKVNPRDMPVHFFFGSVRLDYGSAIRADISRQNCSVCPRYWYLDAIFRCTRCNTEFCFTASEQRHWYEDLGFWVDAFPKKCPACRSQLRNLNALRQEYDRDVARVLRTRDLEEKERLAHVIDQLYEIGGELPERINENRQRLAQQIARFKGSAA